MYSTASAAALDLAEVLREEAANVDSDDLATISESMSRIRAAARELANALLLRGWGGGVLYGFGEPGKWEDQIRIEKDLEDWPPASDESNDEENLDASESEAEYDRELAARTGRRVSFQTRHDFVVTDEVALAAEARLRAERRPGINQEVIDDLVVSNPFMLLMSVIGPPVRVFERAGLKLAGGTSISRTVQLALDELSWADSTDTFPTSLP